MLHKSLETRCPGKLGAHLSGLLSVKILLISIHFFDSIILQFHFNRYKKYFEEGKLEKSLDVVRDYLNRLDELKVEYPHRNYEIATIALCGCTWGMTQGC